MEKLMDNSITCPKCGKATIDAVKFCSNCGTKLNIISEEITETIDESAQGSIDKSNDQNITEQSKDNKPKSIQVSKSTRTKVIIAAMTFMVLTVLGGMWYFGKDHQMQMLESAVTSGNVDKMGDSLMTIKGKKLDKTDLVALNKLIKEKKKTKDLIHKQLMSNKDELFEMKKQGKIMGIFDRYKIEIEGVRVNQTTDLMYPRFYVDGKQVSDEATYYDDEYELTGMLPGIHKIEVKKAYGFSDTETYNMTIDPDKYYNTVLEY